jgi:hypothetical protein
MKSMQCNVDFRYRLRICSWTEENNGKPAALKRKALLNYA